MGQLSRPSPVYRLRAVERACYVLAEQNSSGRPPYRKEGCRTVGIGTPNTAPSTRLVAFEPHPIAQRP